MTTQEPRHLTQTAPEPSRWIAVFSLTMGVFSLVMAEFLPASLLTPMAESLAISEGQTGQAVTVTAIVALLSGLLVTAVTQRLDRRHVLLAFGVANFVGTLVAGFLLERSLRLTLLLMPLLMGVMGWLLATLGGFSMGTDAIMVAVWGFVFGAVPVAWSTWITRVVPDEAESGGGLIVASIQLAIALGAAVGGVMFDISGVLGVCATAGTLLLAAAALILVAVRTRPEASVDRDAIAATCQ